MRGCSPIESDTHGLVESPLHAIETGTPFTMRLWVYQPSWTPGPTPPRPSSDTNRGQAIIECVSATNASLFSWIMGRSPGHPSENAVYARMYLSSGTPLNSSTQWVFDGWNHVVWGYDGSSIFIQLNNGARVRRAAPLRLGIRFNPGDPIEKFDYLKLVSRNRTVTSNDDNAVDSTYDELAVWTTDLTEADVTEDWNSGAGVGYDDTPKQEQLLAYWNLDSLYTDNAAPFTGPAKSVLDQVNGYILETDEPVFTEPQYGGDDGIQNGTIEEGKIENGLKVSFIFGYAYRLQSDDFNFGDVVWES